MLCCKDCFWDVELSHMIQSMSNENGSCTFCGSQTLVIAPTKLREKFEFVKEELFEEDPNGSPLAECFQQEFQVFNTERIPNISRLLEAIFEDEKSYVQGNFKLNVDNSRLSAEWEQLREELISKNRFFPRTDVLTELFRGNGAREIKVFEQIISQLKKQIPLEYKLFRARVIDEITDYKEDLDKPPKKHASDGRANPIGISYLYCSSNRRTAVTEVRPSTGSKVFVANMNTVRSINVLDLTNPRKKFSPFQFADSDSVLALECIVFLEKLSEELSLPIADSRRLNYLPTQFFCEFIKSKKTVDGILFKSSFTKDENFVFFCESSSEIVDFTGYEELVVTETSHEYEKVS